MTSRSLTLFKPGNSVIVRSEAEIQQTLDPMGKLEGLPFMPEMRQYCGKKFRVSGWAHKTCVEGWGLRALPDSVFLDDIRCTGIEHDGCQRACMIFWKTRWLMAIQDDANGRMTTQEITASAHEPRYVTRNGNKYICQSTELASATISLSWWNLKQYWYDLRSAQFSPADFFTMFLRSLFGKISKVFLGHSVQTISGSATKTPRGNLSLTPGEWIVSKKEEEIRQTLDSNGRNRGLEFTPEMAPFCSRTLQVRERVTKIILEQTGEMKEISGTVLLDGALCDGLYHRGCPRKNYFFWRDVWLTKK